MGVVVVPFGEFQYNVDDKGRVVLPPSFRDFVANGMVLTRGFEGCLYIYTVVAWQRMEKDLQNLPLIDGEARQFVRFIYSGASMVKMDSAHRIAISQPLRRFANINDSVVFAGAPNRLELWNETHWLSSISDIQIAPPVPEVLRGLIG